MQTPSRFTKKYVLIFCLASIFVNYVKGGMLTRTLPSSGKNIELQHSFRSCGERIKVEETQVFIDQKQETKMDTDTLETKEDKLNNLGTSNEEIEEKRQKRKEAIKRMRRISFVIFLVIIGVIAVSLAVVAILNSNSEKKELAEIPIIVQAPNPLLKIDQESNNRLFNKGNITISQMLAEKKEQQIRDMLAIHSTVCAPEFIKERGSSWAIACKETGENLKREQAKLLSSSIPSVNHHKRNLEGQSYIDR